MEKLRILMPNDYKLFKKNFTNTYEDTTSDTQIHPVTLNIPRIKKFRKSTSQTDLDKNSNYY